MAAPRKKSAQSTVSVPSGDVSSDAASSVSVPAVAVPPAAAPSAALSSTLFSRHQLEKAPERAFRFLMALGRYPVIMRHLEDVGYSPKRPSRKVGSFCTNFPRTINPKRHPTRPPTKKRSRP